ncbi:MAG: GNAT family N-acetyltransferase [Myxococcota bacterium]
MNYRSAQEIDVPALFDVRLSVRENQQSREGLAAIGMTEASLTDALRSDLRGWVADEAGEIVGFSMADHRDGSIVALFVAPGWEGRGCGSHLHDLAARWLFDEGYDGIWLLTGRGTRAHGFYLRRGWVPCGAANGEDVRLELTVES